MGHRIALVLAAAGALASLGAAPAGAGGSPPSGTIMCGLSGSATFKQPVPPTTPATTTNKLTVKKAAADMCANGGVTGGKAPITGAQVSLLGTIPVGFDCQLITMPPQFTKSKVKIKWTDMAGKTVAVSKTTVASISVAGSGYQLVTAPITKGGFVGATVTAQVNVDNLSDVVTCFNGTSPLAMIAFSTAMGSTITVP